MLLQLAGYETAVAYCGPDGVQTAKVWKLDVVHCDIGLPGMDRDGVAVQLRQDPLLSKMRLIAVTGYGRAEDVQRSREAGFDDHLVKPITSNKLAQFLVPN